MSFECDSSQSIRGIHFIVAMSKTVWWLKTAMAFPYGKNCAVTDCKPACCKVVELQASDKLETDKQQDCNMFLTCL